MKVKSKKLPRGPDPKSLIRAIQRLEARLKCLEAYVASLRTDRSPYTCVNLHD